jgi:hypothetical protein
MLSWHSDLPSNNVDLCGTSFRQAKPHHGPAIVEGLAEMCARLLAFRMRFMLLEQASVEKADCEVLTLVSSSIRSQRTKPYAPRAYVAC